MDARYSHRLDEAVALATDAFRGRVRKGTDVPYLTHLLQVMVWVGEHGGDEEQMIAAVLHDWLEDIEGAELAELERRFGPRVAGLVSGLSDSTTHPKPPWRARKEAYLRHLAGASADLKLISAADKLHNATSIRRDLRTVGPVLWTRFTGARDGTLWYYGAVVEALSSDWDHALLTALKTEVGYLLVEASP